MRWSVLALVFLVSTAGAGEPTISVERIRADVKYLASDRLEGRGIGTRAEQEATDFLAAAIAKAGLQPAGERDTFFQAVPLVGVSTGAAATLAAVKGGE